MEKIPQEESKALRYSREVKEKTLAEVKKKGPIWWIFARYRFYFCTTGYPEDIPELRAALMIPALTLVGLGLLIAAIMGGIRWITCFYKIWYWTIKFKMPDRTRYSLIYNGGKIEKIILPEDQAKLDRKKKIAEKLEQLKQKRLAKRTLAKH